MCDHHIISTTNQWVGSPAIPSPGSLPFGIINLDLNGLKLVNDREGHEAGDELLIQAGELLGKLFYREDLYRTRCSMAKRLLRPVRASTRLISESCSMS